MFTSVRQQQHFAHRCAGALMSSVVKRKRRASRPVAFEPLEGRTLLSGLDFKAIPTSLPTILGDNTSGLMGDIENQIFGLSQNNHSLPLIGNQLKGFSSAAFLTALDSGMAQSENQQDGILNPLNYITDYTQAGTVWNDMSAYFKSLNLTVQNDSAPEGQKVLNSSASNVELDFVLKNSVSITSGLSFQSGLQNLNLGVKTGGALTVSLGYTFDLRVGVDTAQDPVYVDTSPSNELTISLAVTLPGFQATGTLGPLGAQLYDAHLPPTSALQTTNWYVPSQGTPAPTQFTASFTVDVGSSQSDKLIRASAPGNLIIAPKLDGEAKIALGIVIGFPNFVSVGTDFALDWKFDNNTLDGEIPTIAFNDVQISMGSFFSGLIGPVIKDIQQVTEPLQPIVNVLTEELPVLKDVKKFLSSAPDTLEDIFLNQNNSNPDVVTFLNFVKVVNSIPVGPNNASSTIDFGSFNLTNNGAPYDIFSSALNSAPLNSIVSQLNFFGDSQDKGLLGQLEAPPSTDPQNQGLGLNLDFPVFDDPSSLFGILLGQDVTLMKCNLTYNDSPADFSKFYPILGPLGIQLDGSFTFHTDLEFGFDTEFLSQNTIDPTQAFYVKTASITVAASLQAGPGVNLVAASLSLTGGINGTAMLGLQTINSEYNDGLVRLSDLDTDINTYGPLGIFVVSGEIDADLEIHAQLGLNTPFGNIGPQFNLVLASTKILDFNSDDTTIQNEPILAGAGHANQTGTTPGGIPIFDLSASSPYVLRSPGELILNMGPYASQRKNGDLVDGDESFLVTHVSGDPTASGGETVKVFAFDHVEEFTGVTSIWAEGGRGNNEITIDPAVKAPATLFATVDNYLLNPNIPPDPNFGTFDPKLYSILTDAKYQDFHNVLHAGGGNALLVGGQGVGTNIAYYLFDLYAIPPAQILTAVYAGDELIGGQATNTFFGGNAQAGTANTEVLLGGTDKYSKNIMHAGNGGENTLIAGPNGDSLQGGITGTDHFVAGAGDDVMQGGGGANDFSWQEGDGNTTVLGGTGPNATNALDISVNSPGGNFFIGHGASLLLEIGLTIPGQGGNPSVARTINAQNIRALGVDDTGDSATYTVDAQVGTGVSEILVNAHEAGHAGGLGDTVNVLGSMTQSNIIDVSADPAYPDLFNYQKGQVTQSTGPVTIANITIKGGNSASGPAGDTTYQVITAVPKITDTLLVNTGNAADTVSVESTQSAPDGTSQGGDVRVSTGGGNDTINVGTSTPGKGNGLLDRIQGDLYIDAGSGTQNQLNIDEGGGKNGDTLALSSEVVQKSATYELLRYQGEALGVPEGGPVVGLRPEKYRYPLFIQYAANGGQFGAGVALYLTQASDNLYVTDTMLGAPTSVYTDGRGTALDDQITVGFNGADPINRGTPQHSTISGIISPLDVDGTSGPVTNLMLGGADLKVYDELLPIAQNYDVTSSQLGRTGQTPITYASLGTSSAPGTLDLWGVEAGNNIAVEATAAWTTTTIHAGNGTNTIMVGRHIVGFSLDGIQGPLAVAGGTGTNAMTAGDDFSPTHGYNLSATTLVRTGGTTIAPISFSHLSSLTLNEPAVADTTTAVSGTALGTSVFVNTGAGSDALTVKALDQIHGALAFQWHNGAKTALVDDTGAAGNATYTVNLGSNSGTVSRTGSATVTFNYQGSPPDPLTNLSLAAGLTHTDTINVLSIAAGINAKITGGTTANSIVVGDTNQNDPNPDNLDVIQGPLALVGQGSTQLVFDDQKGPSFRTYVLAAASLQVSGSSPAIAFSKIGAISLNAAPAGTVDVQGVASGTTVRLSLSGTGSTVNVGSSMNQLLGAIQGTVTVQGTGTDFVNINDQNGPGMSAYVLTASTVADSYAVIQYANVKSVALNGGKGPSQYFVTNVVATPAVTIHAQGIGNSLTGPNQNMNWMITGPDTGQLTSAFTFTDIGALIGGTGNDQFSFLSGGTLSGLVNGGGGVNTLDYSSDGGLAATVNLALSTATKTGGFASIRNLIGSSSSDTLIGPNATNTWSITASNGGTVGSFSFSSVENLTGGTGLDMFVFSAGKAISGKINGGVAGNDWLDYAAYTTLVQVNLMANTATGVAGGIANIRNVRGGQGGVQLTGNAMGNILIGGAGPNTIVGGNGPSILIGGAGPDNVTGRSGNDILIAGHTTYDSSSVAHDLALQSILAEWQSGAPYGTRINLIKTGANPLVWGVTVLDNAITNANTLTGTGGQNWFFANLAHTKSNWAPPQQFD
jgi:hypothetical protein